jgi:hypothetical protein
MFGVSVGGGQPDSRAASQQSKQQAPQRGLLGWSQRGEQVATTTPYLASRLFSSSAVLASHR